MIDPAGAGAAAWSNFRVATPELEVLPRQNPSARGSGLTCRLQQPAGDRGGGEPFFGRKFGIQMRYGGSEPNLAHDDGRAVRRLLVEIGEHG